MRVAFLGLGVMGYPMAGHLAAAGHDVTVYNRSANKAEAWRDEHPGRATATPAAAARDAELVFTCVGNDDDVRAVVYGDDGALQSMPSGAVLIDHTTTSAILARELYAAAAEYSLGFVDAPLSGGQAGAESGMLTIMIGGDEATFERVAPVLACYAKATTHIGPVGAGQLAKMVNQICIAGVVQGLAEGLRFAQRADLDIAKVIDAISGGAAQSWQMQNRWETMAAGEFDFGFAVDWMRKDLKFALEEAETNGSVLELVALVDTFYAEVQALGGNRWDTSSLIARLP
ncbi:MAG: NAD(P)-dependent oxidoreductase [Gammaproteobacteria bacterium]|nr:NAD(P)-dependent oxidoreductase [Gammaproteobacteria bacterium]